MSNERLEQALEVANFRLTILNQKANARTKLKKDLTFSSNGGIFYISQELITFTNTLLSWGKKDAILIDENQNPIYIANLEEFVDNIRDKYFECMNEFLVEFKEINKTRSSSVKNLMGVD